MTDLEERLLTMLEQERALNLLLTRSLLPQTGEQIVSIPGAPKSLGRVPWAVLKSQLEAKFRSVNEEPVSDTDERDDEGSNHGHGVEDAGGQ